ncbi:hypothetical protein P7C71_g4956, partial [Lecanoromycetidae sp. Uapishka_2]
MPKHKPLLRTKEKVGKKGKPEGPTTANEYLAAGVDFEEAGEKWRAGDAAKSMRFFIRAIETYGAGLQTFPQSFDLAYNNNTAQVLTSIADIHAEGSTPSESHRDEALSLLREALELFQRCLTVQEFKFTQAQKDFTHGADLVSEANETDTGDTSRAVSNASEEELWASVEELITKDTLLDTTIAQLDTLTAISSLGSIENHNDVAWIEEYYRDTLQSKVLAYSDESSHQHEAALAKSKLVSAISDAAFRSGRLDIPTYEHEMNTAFHELDLTDDSQGLCDRADAYLSFSASIQLSIGQAQPNEIAALSIMGWKYITKALDSLTTASKLPDAQNLPRIHLRRGDCELLRLRLSQEPFNYDLAIKSAPTLLKNAEVYFRGSAKLAKSEDAGEEQFEAGTKEAVAAVLRGDTTQLSSLVKHHREQVEAVLEDMRDDGLLGEESMREIVNL